SRHHKRRLISASFADLAARRLVPSGHWRLATDWKDYALAMREVLDSHPAFVNCHAGWAPRWPDRPQTRYEAKGLAAGRTIYDLCYACL
ncbi:tRNA (guanine(46)-N(7))-methyltransferase TrmB, partial [Streptobacillus moniliformis]|uniref:tRNA (guanine(46)-N(7))-methyltransferase TrmB n=1 Tax=Streptobacillus moniliformis TaxID=34105 RepID=UPI001E53CCEB